MSMLTRLAALTNIDVDDASTAVVRSLPFTPYNQTSNQGIITSELLKPENDGLLAALVAKYGAQGWEAVYNKAAVALVARNVPFLSGRVLIQVSLRHLDDKAAIVAQCREYAASFAELGVPTDRYAIKLPFSGAAAAAARTLKDEGIATLATSVFCMEQAVAASQAGCVMISPYYNEIAAHIDPAVHINVADTALEHPMSPRILQMLTFFASQPSPQPIMVIASHITPQEVLAMADLGCPHITISAANLAGLAALPDPFGPVATPKPSPTYTGWKTPAKYAALEKTDPLASAGWAGVTASMATDYVADNGKALDEYIRSDALVSHRIEDARKFFLAAENVAKKAIEAKIAAGAAK